VAETAEVVEAVEPEAKVSETVPESEANLEEAARATVEDATTDTADEGVEATDPKEGE
jgi:hypothetical protein